MSPDEITNRHPLKPGRAATEPEETTCPHGFAGLWFRWEWSAKYGSEDQSDPIILENPADCHECNCNDPFCKRCWEDD